GMAHDRVLELDRRDPLPAALDDVLGAVGDLDVAVGIDVDDVAGAEPPVVERLRRARVLVVARGDPGTAHLELADALTVPGKLRAVLADDPPLDARYRSALTGADAPTVVVAPRVHGATRLRDGREWRRLGHAPRLHDGDAPLVE